MAHQGINLFRNDVHQSDDASRDDMRYLAGHQARLGDRIDLGGGMTGIVVALVDEDLYDARFPKSEWGVLKDGILVESPEAGLVHYPADTGHGLELIERDGGRSKDMGIV